MLTPDKLYELLEKHTWNYISRPSPGVAHIDGEVNMDMVCAAINEMHRGLDEKLGKRK